jgi:AcrR family transcriptional regulator
MVAARPAVNGVGHGTVTEMQRGRILTAAVEIVGDLGYEGMSVARVTARARVSRRTFYELFDSREDCFLAAFEDGLVRAAALVGPAHAAPRAWREQVRAGLGALLVFMDQEPRLAALCVVEALGGGRRVLERRKAVLDVLRDAVDEGRGAEGSRVRRDPSPLTAEGVVGAVLALVHDRLLESDRRPLSDLLNPLMSIIVLPYLGAAAAARELEQPRLPVARPMRQVVSDPLADVPMRLTYRTLRVLGVIAAQPEASNREVADAAGVQDQGQISKLLARLEHLGLVENTGKGHAKGEPNAWRLTSRGNEVQHLVP